MRKIALVLLLGCAPPAPSAPLRVVPHGKEDNYYSNVAAEFEVDGALNVLVADPADQNAQIARRMTAFGLYLTTYVTAKFRGEDINGDGQITDDEVFFHNDKYGGFQAMVRNYTIKPGDVTPIDGGVSVKFKIDLAGPPDLLSKLGTAFDLAEPAGAAVDPGKADFGIIRSFDPTSYTGELERVACTAHALPAVGNAYPHFKDFISDGVYDLTLFQGYDYNASRSDLAEARELYDNLVAWGFQSPAASFEALTADSGPFTWASHGVNLEVRLFHSDMFKSDRKRQHDLAISELTTRDVFFYNGHAGPYYGFYLDAAGEAKVGYTELTKAPFTDKQQLFIAAGCQTYSQYADMIYANPAKNEGNLDVITTVNFSYGQGGVQLLADLIELGVPRSFYQIIGDLNLDAINSEKQVFYGVMGLDGDPQLHPYANPASLGQKCAAVTDCGDEIGNVCGDFGNGDLRCGAIALAAAGCPAGSTYYDLAAGDTIQYGGCF